MRTQIWSNVKDKTETKPSSARWKQKDESSFDQLLGSKASNVKSADFAATK